ncbi:MAG: glycosyltransferase family 1 protein [Chromatiales bacterium]|nr:glycosyltransferase family 1 protein [Chromatiales bacterium]
MDQAATARPDQDDTSVTATGGALRVALVTETYPPEINGVAHTLSHLAQGLAERGHAVEVVRPRQDATDRATDDPATTHGIAQLLTGGLPAPGYPGLHLGLPAGRRLRRRWRAQRPDVVYIATEGPLGHSALAAARQLQIPVLSGFHTNFDAYTRFYRIGLLEPLVLAWLRRFHNRCQGTLAPTAALAARLEARGFRHMGVLARGVDTTLFDPARRDPGLRAAWGLAPGALAVLYVGRLAAEKNIALTIEAFKAIRRVHPDSRLVLVGDGPLRERLARELPEAIFCGPRRGEDLARHYASADLFLFASTSETYGNVVIEAMASGLPVLTYDYAAGREHIHRGVNGQLAPFDDASAFVAAARAMTRDPQALQALGRQARITAERLAWGRIIQRFEHGLRAAIQLTR